LLRRDLGPDRLRGLRILDSPSLPTAQHLAELPSGFRAEHEEVPRFGHAVVRRVHGQLEEPLDLLTADRPVGETLDGTTCLYRFDDVHLPSRVRARSGAASTITRQPALRPKNFQWFIASPRRGRGGGAGRPCTVPHPRPGTAGAAAVDLPGAGLAAGCTRV